jgi:hypothetical protein
MDGKGERTMKGHLGTIGTYPCDWDDLLDDDNMVVATIYTLHYVRTDPELAEECRKWATGKGFIWIQQCPIDDVYEIIFDLPQLTEQCVKLAELIIKAFEESRQ